VGVPEKEKKRIIWTFMEELIENYETQWKVTSRRISNLWTFLTLGT
jgi:hypothetical protein